MRTLHYSLGLLLVATLVAGVLPPAAAAAQLEQAPPGVPEQAADPGERPAEHIPGRYIVVYRPTVRDPEAKTNGLERARGFRADQRYGHALPGFASVLSDPQVAALKDDPDVEFVSPDRPVRAHDVVALAANETAPTGVRRIEAATTQTVRQASTANVAILDTGIDLDHPDLNAVPGKNCMGSGLPDDDHGHGTHAAGSVGAKNDGAGVVGVAPGTTLHSVKVLDAKGNGTFSQVICGIDWATSTRRDLDPANDIAVANLSLSGTTTPVVTCSTTLDGLHRAICNSTAAGVTYVVAAGNTATEFDHLVLPDAPAAYPQVLTVAAAADSDGLPGGNGGPACDGRQSDDTYATFSNYAATSAGAAHLVAAPGSCIASTYLNGAYAISSGTSMAAPHVAGLMALCLGEGGVPGPCAGLSPAQIIDKIRDDARARTTTDATYGFAGDPLRPHSGRSYGYLAWTSSNVVPGSAHRLDVFARGTDNRLSQRSWDGTRWLPEVPLEGVVDSDPAAVSWGPGRIDLFARATDGQLIHKAFAGGRWYDWRGLGGTLTSGPAVASWAAGRLDVFVRGTNGRVFQRTFDGRRWLPYAALAGVVDSAPAAVSWGPGRIDLFARATDGQLIHKAFAGGRWYDWRPLGGVLTGAPAVASWAAGRLDVFVKGTDGRLFQRTFDGTRWLPYTPLDGVVDSAPAAVSGDPGRIDLFARGTNKQLMHKTFAGGRWYDWRGLGGTLTSGPAATSG